MKRAFLGGIVVLAIWAGWLLLDRRASRGEGGVPPAAEGGADAALDATPALATRMPRSSRVLSGIVVDDAGAPIVGAEIVVVARDEAGLEGEPAARRVVTGADGRYTFPDPPRDAVARALHPDYVEMGHEPVLETEDGVLEEMEFWLVRGSALDVIVTGADGVGWAGGVLYVQRPEGEERHLALDAKGSCRIERWPAGVVHLLAFRSDGARAETVSGEASLRPGATARADLDARTGLTVVGRVVRGDKGVARADVWLQFPAISSADAFGRTFDRFVTLRTDEEGRFVVRGAPPGEATCWVRLSSGRRGSVAPETRGNEWVLRLPQSLLEGRVIASGSGAPIAGATVSVQTAEPTLDDFHGGEQVTDAAGRFHFEDLAPGRYVVHALRGDGLRGSDWVETTESGVAIAEGAGTQITLRMEQGGTATIVVVDGAGATVRGAKVSWQRDPSRPDAPWGGTTAADGRVRARGLRPGKTTIVVREAGYSVEAQASVSAGEDTETRVVVPWRPLGLVRIRVVGVKPLSRADIGIRLSAAKGTASLSGAQLEVDPSDADVRLARLFAGKWSLVVSATGHVPWTVDVDVAPGETRDLEVQLAWMTSDSTQEPDAPVEDDH